MSSLHLEISITQSTYSNPPKHDPRSHNPLPPEAFREVHVPPTITPTELHAVIQAAFGWHASQEFDFLLCGKRGSGQTFDPHVLAEDDPHTLESILDTRGAALYYIYGHPDNAWLLEIALVGYDGRRRKRATLRRVEGPSPNAERFEPDDWAEAVRVGHKAAAGAKLSKLESNRYFNAFHTCEPHMLHVYLATPDPSTIRRWEKAVKSIPIVGGELSMLTHSGFEDDALAVERAAQAWRPYILDSIAAANAALVPLPAEYTREFEHDHGHELMHDHVHEHKHAHDHAHSHSHSECTCPKNVTVEDIFTHNLSRLPAFNAHVHAGLGEGRSAVRILADFVGQEDLLALAARFEADHLDFHPQYAAILGSTLHDVLRAVERRCARTKAFLRVSPQAARSLCFHLGLLDLPAEEQVSAAQFLLVNLCNAGLILADDRSIRLSPEGKKALRLPPQKSGMYLMQHFPGPNNEMFMTALVTGLCLLYGDEVFYAPARERGGNPLHAQSPMWWSLVDLFWPHAGRAWGMQTVNEVLGGWVRLLTQLGLRRADAGDGEHAVHDAVRAFLHTTLRRADAMKMIEGVVAQETAIPF